MHNSGIAPEFRLTDKGERRRHFEAERACDAEKRPASGMGRIESFGRTYERPALRKPFAAFPADSKVA